MISRMESGRGTTWLLFDGECRVCSAAAAWVHALDFRHHLQVRPLQDARGLLVGVPPEELLEAFRAVAPDGRVAAGPQAIPVVLAALSGAEGLDPLLRSSPAAMSALSHLYDVMVDVRGRLTCRTEGSVSAAQPPR